MTTVKIVVILQIPNFSSKLPMSANPAEESPVACLRGRSIIVTRSVFSHHDENKVKTICGTKEIMTSLYFFLYKKYSINGAVMEYLKYEIARNNPAKTSFPFFDIHTASKKKKEGKKRMLS